MKFEALSLATPGVQGLAPYQPGKPIDELEREYGVSHAVKLASNENPLGPSELAVSAARAALSDVHRYPDGSGHVLKKALARKLGVESACITLGNGSSDILEFLARAFVQPQHEVVFSEYAFALYPILTRAVGAKPVVTKARDWGHDLAAMRASVNERTRLVFIANPNNPTGTWINAQALESFVQSLPGHVLVAIDEAYFEYVQQAEYPSTIGWSTKYPNLITTRTFSKVYGLAGLRVGYGVSSPELADILNRVRPPFNVNHPALAAASAALEDARHVTAAVQANRQGMHQLTAALIELGVDFIPSVGNFVCVDCRRPAALIYQRLLREGMIVRPLANYAMPNHLRVTLGLAEENERFIQALGKVLHEA